MQLARVFQDYMVLQRHMPICIWGHSECYRSVEVKLNGRSICKKDIPAGDFTLMLPAQEAFEDATLEIADIRLEHVDIGEVWIAGGQSNMEYMLRYDENGEAEITAADDIHLRTYIVGQYSYPGEREKGYKAWNPWDRWLTYTPEHAPVLPAVAVYFAQELRKQGVPVGILSCNWGGTSASAWTDRETLRADEDLNTYLTDFDKLTSQLDLTRFHTIQNLARPALASEEAQVFTAEIMHNTFHPHELKKRIAAELQRSTVITPEGHALTPEELYAVGPGDRNEPGALYENMLTEVIGYSAKGVIWYQGETDEYKAHMYAKLFTAMIDCWRKAWLRKNEWMTRLPFLFVQLAPYGIWTAPSGADQVSDRYPELRIQQQLAADIGKDVYMACISDLGNVYDIHPKVKKPVGHRLALLARKYVYGDESLLADAPRADHISLVEKTLHIHFQYGDGLHLTDADFTSYNGFHICDIFEHIIPPVLAKVNGLQIYADGIPVECIECSVEHGELVIYAEEFANVKQIRVLFAQTPFHQVNLFNRVGLPARPFELMYNAI